MSLLELFCHVDDFCQTFEPHWQRTLVAQGTRRRNRSGQLSTSGIMTIVIRFHQSHYRDFKSYSCEHVLTHLRSEFPRAVSYQRFVELMQRVLLPLLVYVQHCAGCCTGISLTRPHCRSVIIAGSLATRSSMVWQLEAKPRWVGSMASNSILSSTTAANC